jgi:acyl-CoA synthetase (AMP-forming)/AMP-acid ligase II
MLESERVTMTAGVPTIWLGLLAHLRSSNERLTHLKRMLVAGSALPRLLVEEFYADGRQRRTRLGHDRNQPDRHLQFADAGKRGPGRRRGHSPAAEARPRLLGPISKARFGSILLKKSLAAMTRC